MVDKSDIDYIIVTYKNLDTCARNGCNNFLPSLYSEEFGYLCAWCKDEMLEKFKHKKITKEDIKEFMETEHKEKEEKDYTRINERIVNEIFK